MRLKLIFLLLATQLCCLAQQKVMTQNGVTIFEASMPSFEEVKAVNKSSVCVLNTITGDIASIILIKNFKFKLALMEEHFNENYMESEKFPKATFKGKIINFDLSKLTSQKQEFKMKGTFEIHGKAKEIMLPVMLQKNKEAIVIISEFLLNTDDFDIDLPILIRSKVAKQVNVNINFVLQ